jgi:hypothetical protein
MAVEKSRSFNEQAGAVHVVIENLHGSASHHTFYVMGIEDVNQEIAKRLLEVDAQAEVIRKRMLAAGMPVK